MPGPEDRAGDSPALSPRSMVLARPRSTLPGLLWSSSAASPWSCLPLLAAPPLGASKLLGQSPLPWCHLLPTVLRCPKASRC